jgi:hypothetical protein
MCPPLHAGLDDESEEEIRKAAQEEYERHEAGVGAR